MNVSISGVDFIRMEENRPLMSQPDHYITRAYPDTNGYAIGYGCTFFQNGNKVKAGDAITKAQAEVLLDYHVRLNAGYLNQYLAQAGVKLNQPQFDAVVSFIYNAGPGNFLKSQLWTAIKANPNNLAAVEAGFRAWPSNPQRRQREAYAYAQPSYSAGGSNTNWLLLLLVGAAGYVYYNQ